MTDAGRPAGAELSDADKRYGLRLRKYIDVVVEDPLSAMLFRGAVADISPTGMRIIADQYLPVGSKYTFTMKRNPFLRLRGQVRWIRTFTADTYQVGVLIVEATEDDRKRSDELSRHRAPAAVQQQRLEPTTLASDYDFALPAELIAQAPAAQRDASRLLVLDGDSTADRRFSDLPDYFHDRRPARPQRDARHRRAHFRRTRPHRRPGRILAAASGSNRALRSVGAAMDRACQAGATSARRVASCAARCGSFVRQRDRRRGTRGRHARDRVRAGSAVRGVPRARRAAAVAALHP